MNVNLCVIAGRLTADPEARALPSGESVVEFCVAVNSKAKDGTEKGEFFDCVAFDKAGAGIMQYLAKGRNIHIIGRLRQKRWESKDGQKRQKVEIVVDRWQFADSRDAQAPAPVPQMTPPACRREKAPAAAPVEPVEMQGEIPF